MNKPYLIGWLIILTQAGFLEYFAVKRAASGDTFSELMWSIIQFHPLFFYVMIGVFAWLVVHFLSGGKWA